MRVLVTGATGFIGRACVAELAAAGAEVHGVARTAPPPTAGVVGHAADLFDPAQVGGLVAAVRPTHLLHVAWVTTPGEYWASPLNLRWLAASAELVRAFAASGGRRVVGVGTCAEYDWARAGVCDEADTPVAPATLYGACKDALRRVIERFAATAGLSAAWGRVFFPYGPGEAPERLVASVARSLLAGRPALCSAGTQVRDFIHVRDVAGALVALLHREDVTGAVNVGTGRPVVLADVIQRVGAITGRPDLIRLGARPKPATEPAVLCAGTRRLSGEVGWRPRADLDAGLAETVAWWRGFPADAEG